MYRIIFISRKERRGRRKTLKVEYSLLFTLALEGSQLARDGGRRGGWER